MLALWHWFIHVTGTDNGLPYGTWNFYNFWSGFGSDLGEIVIIGYLVTWTKHHICHTDGCYRLAFHKVEGTPYTVCRKHHPDMLPKGKVTLEHIHKLHADYMKRKTK